MLVVLSSTVVLAQSQPDGQIPREDISSYIFSPYAITFLLVLALIAQIAYRQRGRIFARKETGSYLAQPVAVTKKRYDRDELSKLLKASATSKKSGRTLEEAIRLSQLMLPDLAEHVDVRDDSTTTDAPALASVEANSDDEALIGSAQIGVETEDRPTPDAGDEAAVPVSDALPSVERESQDVSVEDVDENDFVK